MRNIFSNIKFTAIINALLTVFVLYFIVRFFQQQWPQITAIKIKFNILLLVLCVLIFEIYWFIQVLNWKSIMSQLGIKLPLLDAGYFYFFSCLLAYIPGKVGNAIGMASLAEKHKVSKTRTVTAVFLVQIYALISGAFVISITWFLLIDKVKAIFSPFLIFIILGMITGLIFISPKFISITQRLAEIILKRKFDKIELKFLNHILNILVFSGCWFILALSLWCLLRSCDPSFSIKLYLDVMDIFVGSYLVGLLAITLPSGLGVVELGLSYGYSLIGNPKIALIGAIGFRILVLTTIIVSFLCIAKIKYILNLKSKRRIGNI